MSQPIGHLDFYPNGGEHQPGCDQGMMKYIDRENNSFYQGMRRFLACDHVRAHEFFNESVNTHCNFIAIECNSYEEFLNGECFSCLSDTVCTYNFINIHLPYRYIGQEKAFNEQDNFNTIDNIFFWGGEGIS